ncbi:hypothetical protein GHT06_017064 [Daphnia sinensis]|uniref:Uncharacterized protein n=1 Tax=Daphnia sinensis TaxID=1820382 RepID=A0AAD5KPC2_9CRUS|nr:hypothetical protein GHT06_017064 [Daphnia sinensis]
MAHLSSSRCSFCGFDIGRKHFCCCLSCKSTIHRTCCGSGAPTWDEFRSNYRCVKCDVGCSTNAACVNEGVASDGVGGAAVGDGNVVAGSSRNRDDVEAISARGESRLKRAVKRREILDPSHVSKRRKVHKALEKPKSPSTCRESSSQHSSSPQTPQRNATPIGLLLVMSPILSLLYPISSSPEIPPVPPPRRMRRPLQIQNISVSLEDPPIVDSDGYRDEAPAELVKSTMEESSFEEPTESNFQLHHDGSNRGKVKLTNGLGYCFTKKAESNATYTWRCSSRPAKNACKAIVRQKKQKSRDFDFDWADFTEIPHDADTKHNHAPDHGNHIRVPIFMEAKQVAAKEKFTAPREILYGEIKKRKSIKRRDMPHIDNATRRLRYHRSQFMPANPMKNEPFFDVKVDFLTENFYQGPIYAGSATDRARHHLFFTPVMKRQLEDCRAWLIDATVHFVNDPIKQLLSINGFIKNSKGHLKQIPLLFCCVTRRRATDYAAVFQKLKVLKKNINESSPEDCHRFRRTIFVADRKYFENCTHFGCNLKECRE